MQKDIDKISIYKTNKSKTRELSLLDELNVIDIKSFHNFSHCINTHFRIIFPIDVFD